MTELDDEREVSLAANQTKKKGQMNIYIYIYIYMVEIYKMNR